MKATIEPRESDRVGKYRRDTLEKQISVIGRDTGREIVTLRAYRTASRCYACIWIHGRGVYARGGGWADGYGYHRASAAAQEAMIDAGVTLSEPIDGVGDDAMRNACEAIARAVTGKRKFFVVEAHA